MGSRPLSRKELDIRELPSYRTPEVAHYLRIPLTTLRSWVQGRHYPTRGGARFFKPIIELPDPDSNLLSFVNLVEVHILDAVRRDHRIPLHKVRRAVDYLKESFSSEHPLADHKLETDGLDLFVEKYGHLINISQKGQLALRKLLEAHLQRLDRDTTGVPLRLYPFTRKRLVVELGEEPKAIVIDPHISFGRPVLTGTGISTAIVAERYKAGEAIEELADDYGLSSLEIEEAIRCELPSQAA